MLIYIRKRHSRDPITNQNDIFRILNSHENCSVNVFCTHSV